MYIYTGENIFTLFHWENPDDPKRIIILVPGLTIFEISGIRQTPNGSVFWRNFYK
jgi:hypothetical protein